MDKHVEQILVDTMHPTEKPVPFKKGDWIESTDGTLQVGTVKDCYWSMAYGKEPAECLVDVYLYDYEGQKIGRRSPALGGPRNFEPSMSAADWQRIEAPRFPIEVCKVPRPLTDGQTEADRRFTLQYATRAKVLPKREFIPKPRKARMIAIVPAKKPDNVLIRRQRPWHYAWQLRHSGIKRENSLIFPM